VRVLIAGGGPSGATLAALLAEQGWTVTLADALPSPLRNAYSSAALPLADAERLGIPHHCRSAPWSGWQLLDPAGLEHQWWAGEPLGVVLDFAAFRSHLWRRVQRAGVELLCGWRVSLQQLRATSADVLLTSADGAVRRCTVDVLVDATGPGRALLRQAGVAVDSPTDPLLTGEGVEWLLQGTPGTTARWRDRLSFMLGSHWVPHGYGWVFPMEADRLKIGVCRMAPPAGTSRPLSVSLRGLLQRCGLGHLPVLDRHGGRVSSTVNRQEQLGEGALWAVGDAASTANLLGGEGIRHAMDSAAILGQCLLTGRPRMEYRSLLLQHFGWRWRVSNRLARRTWWGLDDQRADRRMARLIHGLSGQASAEGLSTLLFHYRFERYGWRLLPYLL